MAFSYCGQCERERKYQFSVPRSDQIFHFYQCPECGSCDHRITYKYNPATCPGHQWEHVGIEFRDYKDHHEIEQVDRCDRCGALRRIPRHTSQAGFSGRVEIEDPRVRANLLFNRSSWEREIPKWIREESVGTPPEHAEIPSE
jgi:hypothetical protein